MKSLRNGRFVIAVLTVACLTTVLLTVTPIRSSSPASGEYDPWLDWNDDSKIDIKDVSRVARAYGTNGTNVSKASLAYDSGWIDITGMTGQNITITHGLNITDWNDEGIVVDITGRTTPDGELHRNLGLYSVPVTAGNMTWNMTYGGTGSEVALDLVRTIDGGYALAGSTTSFGAGGYDFWLVKTDANGNMQWNQTYGGINGERANALVQTNDGGFALAGYTTSFGAGGYDSWLVKTDADGNMQWNRTYGGTGLDLAYGLVQTTEQGYALAGYTMSFGAGLHDFWLVKTDANGNIQWSNTYGGTDRDYAFDLVQTNEGGYALSGFTGSFGAGSNDAWLVKTDALGTEQWNKTYGGIDNECFFALVQTADGRYVLAGSTFSYGSGGEDSWLVNTDASGNILWNKTYGKTNSDFAWDLVQTVDGGYALAGSIDYSYDVGGGDFWLVKTDSDGDMQWNKTYSGIDTEISYALVQTVDGGYALAGYTASFGAGANDFWLVKTDVGSGLAWVDSTADTITLYRGAIDTSWNYVRVRLWKLRETP